MANKSFTSLDRLYAPNPGPLRLGVAIALAWMLPIMLLLALLAYVLFFMVPWALSGVIG